MVGSITISLTFSKSGGEADNVADINGVFGPDSGDDLKIGDVIGESESPPIRIFGRG